MICERSEHKNDTYCRSHSLNLEIEKRKAKKGIKIFFNQKAAGYKMSSCFCINVVICGKHLPPIKARLE